MKCRSGKEKIECKAGATEMEIRETRSKFSTFRLKSYFFRKDKIFLMRNGKISIFIERKLNENEVENFVENTSKFANILHENERIWFLPTIAAQNRLFQKISWGTI